MKWKLLPLIILMTALTAFAAAGGEQTRVLIVDGFSNHDWKRTTACLTELLARHGGYSVDVSTFPRRRSSGRTRSMESEFRNYDVVIQNTNGGTQGPEWGATAKNLEQYLKEGGGMLAFHSANNAFPQWPEYNRMIGLGWRPGITEPPLIVTDDGAVLRLPPGEGGPTSHGARIDALVTRLGNHPMHAGLPRQWRAADIEVYRYTRAPPNRCRCSPTRGNPPRGSISRSNGRYGTAKEGCTPPRWGTSGPETPLLKGVQCAGFPDPAFPRPGLAGRKAGGWDCSADFPSPDKTSLRTSPAVSPAPLHESGRQPERLRTGSFIPAIRTTIRRTVRKGFPHSQQRFRQALQMDECH